MVFIGGFENADVSVSIAFCLTSAANAVTIDILANGGTEMTFNIAPNPPYDFAVVQFTLSADISFDSLARKSMARVILSCATNANC
jgi:hypothetical protein